MSLIKTNDEIKKYLSVDISLQDRTIEPYIKPAEEQVIRLLGKEQYEELDDYYNLGEEADEDLDALLPYVQRPIVNFAFFMGLSMLNVTIGEHGIAVISNSNLTPASKQRTDDLKADLEKAAYDALESLLEFLELNVDTYTSWVGSEAYAYQYEFLVSSARRFDELLRIDRSRLTFLQWRPTMSDVEHLEIYPQVSKAFCDELKEEMKAGEVSTENQKVLPLLQKAVAYLTAAIEKDKKYEVRGRQYLMEAKRIMDAAPTDYPTYAASTAYDSELANYQTYENQQDSNFFVTG